MMKIRKLIFLAACFGPQTAVLSAGTRGTRKSRFEACSGGDVFRRGGLRGGAAQAHTRKLKKLAHHKHHTSHVAFESSFLSPRRV